MTHTENDPRADNTPGAENTPASPAEKERVLIFDTTLRDGEQSPGATMTLEEKLEVARVLDAMGVDIIEAGFAIASEGDFEAVRQIGEVVKDAVVCSLARADIRDVERAGQALKTARKPRIHTFIATSPVHMKHKLQMTPEEVLEAITRSVSQARNLVDDVEWSPEDATRTEPDFLCRCVEAAIVAGARTINIPDTVGYCAPDEYAAVLAMLRRRVPGMDRAVLSVHCHNDLGLAVANSLAGIMAGARQAECTINGIGERAGNAAMEEIVMALKVRGDLMPYHTGIDTRMINRASRLVSLVTGFPVQYNKAIVGQNAFAHEAGIHQDGMLKNTQTYEIMKPESVGISTSSLVLGKHSGRHAFREKLAQMGYSLGDNALKDVFERFKALADRKKQVYDDDIIALVDDEAAQTAAADGAQIQVVSLRVEAGTFGPQKAALELMIDGRTQGAEASGEGPVDAAFNAVRALVPHTARLALYQVHAVTGGTDAQAEVSVRLEEDGRTVTGRGVDTDTLVASVRAYVGALNRLAIRRGRTLPRAHIGP